MSSSRTRLPTGSPPPSVARTPTIELVPAPERTSDRVTGLERASRPNRVESATAIPTAARVRSRSRFPGDALGRAIAEQVRQVLRQVPRRPLSPELEQAVQAGYFPRAYAYAFEEACRMGHLRFSIRHPGGPYTSMCLEHRAPPKGHDIPSKTVKLKTLVEAYGQVRGRELLALMEKIGGQDGPPIAGRVGVWSDDKPPRLLGFYLSPEVNRWADAADPRRKALHDASRPVPVPPPRPGREPTEPGFAYRYVPIDVDDLEASLATLLATPDWTEHVFGGDIDLHNLQYHGTAVSEGGGDEKRAMHLIASALGAADDYRRLGTGRPELQAIRHGAQENIGAFVKNQEPDADVPIELTRTDLPVFAFISRPAGSPLMFEIKTPDVYDRHFPLKDSQRADGLTRYEPGRQGGLKLVRSASSMTLNTPDAAVAAEAARRHSAARSASTATGSGDVSPTSRRTSQLFPDSAGRGGSDGGSGLPARPAVPRSPGPEWHDPFGEQPTLLRRTSSMLGARRGSLLVSPRGSLSGPSQPSRLPQPVAAAVAAPASTAASSRSASPAEAPPSAGDPKPDADRIG